MSFHQYPICIPDFSFHNEMPVLYYSHITANVSLSHDGDNEMIFSVVCYRMMLEQHRLLRLQKVAKSEVSSEKDEVLQ